MIILYSGLVYWGLTPQQQPGSYQGGENDDDEIILYSGYFPIQILGQFMETNAKTVQNFEFWSYADKTTTTILTQPKRLMNYISPSSAPQMTK